MSFIKKIDVRAARPVGRAPIQATLRRWDTCTTGAPNVIGQTIGNAIAGNVEQSQQQAARAQAQAAGNSQTDQTLANIMAMNVQAGDYSSGVPTVAQTQAALSGLTTGDSGQVPASYAGGSGAGSYFEGPNAPIGDDGRPVFASGSNYGGQLITGGYNPDDPNQAATLIGIKNSASAPAPVPQLTQQSIAAILASPLNDKQSDAFEAAVLNAGSATGVDPNILVGLALQESTLGANMNIGGAAKGLFGVESSGQDFINQHFNSGITTSDLTSLEPDSIAKVTLGVAQYLARYSNIYSNYTDPAPIDVALSAWRVGIGRTQQNIRAGNFFDYKDPNLGETVQHYVDSVEKLR